MNLLGNTVFSALRKRRTSLALALGALAGAQLWFWLGSAHLPTAYAQAITDDDVANYARAVFEMEAERVNAYELASDILTSADSELNILETPLSCQQARLSDMPDISRADRIDLRAVLVTFCNEAQTIAEANDLTPKRFNAITAAHREDEALAGRIQEAIQAL
ncbi:MAG: DUF4168 domain-containing protein [Cyanobacteria bacterium J06631_12]